jgi:hypothetical protein
VFEGEMTEDLANHMIEAGINPAVVPERLDILEWLHDAAEDLDAAAAAREQAIGRGLHAVTLLDPVELEALKDDYRDALVAFEAALEAGAAALLPYNHAPSR